MKLSNVAGYTNPLNGQKGSLLDPSNWFSNILGVLFLLVVFATGQHLSGLISGKIPGVSTQINPIITQPPSNAGIQKYII